MPELIQSKQLITALEQSISIPVQQDILPREQEHRTLEEYRYVVRPDIAVYGGVDE